MTITKRPAFPKGTLIVVCDGAKALFFENGGDERELNLLPLKADVEPHPPTREMGASPPTRVFDSHDGSRSGVEQTDWHRQAEIAFLREVARTLETFASQRQSPRIVIAAPPRALGVLREVMGKTIQQGLIVELAKDLVRHPTSEIERHIAQLAP